MRNFTGFKIIVLLIFFAALIACSGTRRQSGETQIIQMSDTQFGFYDPQNFAEETKRFSEAIAIANKIKPAMVIVTGDMLNKPFDPGQTAAYKRIADRLDPSISYFQLPGNHDIGNIPTPADISAYRNAFGKDFYSIKKGDILILVINSLYLHSPQKVTSEASEQENWLKAELAATDDKKFRHKIVFMHHPLFLSEAGEEDAYFNIPKERRMKYLQLFRQHGISHIFAGHYHRNAFGLFEGMEMVTTGPVGKPLGKDSSGIRIITVGKKGISHKYQPLELSD